MESLQFINAKISNVSQNNLPNNNSSKKNEIAGDRLVNRINLDERRRITVDRLLSSLKVINGTLEIDHLTLNIINAFTEEHFSFETQKLTGQLFVLLVINPNQYAIEASLKELQLTSSNIINRNNVNLVNSIFLFDRCSILLLDVIR